MNKILLFAVTFITSFSILNAQNNFASEVIILNGESFGANQANIASYDLVSKNYNVFDTLGTSSVQDILIEDSIAYVATESKVIAYNLNSKTKIVEAVYPGVSPNKNALFTDENNLYVGNWFGQTDSFLYAYDKTTLTLNYAVSEATEECGGGLALNDTIYIGQKLKGTIDGCAPFGCFEDTMGLILVADATTGDSLSVIDLGTDGAGIEQIYHEGNFIFAVCPTANNIIKIEIATDSIHEIVSLAPFTQSLQKVGSRLYLDLNGKAGYYDLADGSTALSALDLAGSALAYDPNTETAFTTNTDFFSFGSLSVNNASTNDTVSVGISPEAIGIFYIANAAPVAMDDAYEFIYNENTESYILDVLNNDNDPDGGALTLTSISNATIPGASATIINNQIEYYRSPGVATTDIFTYSVCDVNNVCDTAEVTVNLKSLLSVNNTKENEINIFPNPAHDFLFIETNDVIEEICLIDLTGKYVKKVNVNKINLQDINKGIYFVSVRTSNNVLTQKITIKQ